MSHEKVAPTAWWVARQRALGNLPYSQEITDELKATLTPAEAAKAQELWTPESQKLAPRFEARYRLLSKLAEQSGSKQILELAAGMSARGIEMTEDPRVMYVEVEMPRVAEQKRHILAALERSSKIPRRDNLYLEEGNVLARDSLLRAASHFDASKPIAIIHEGLLRYFNAEEKIALADTVRVLLERFGGVWITPDITLKAVLNVENKVLSDKEKISAAIGIDIDANSFVDLDAAKDFFSGAGFAVEWHDAREVKEYLLSPARLGLTDEQVEQVLRYGGAFVMTLNGHSNPHV